jgi:peptidoglycan/xylan/chitin deacetylase (PgdA/CDA1 family)
VVLRHHRVYDAGARPLYRIGVSSEVFERQLELLARLGFAPVTIREGLAWLGAAAEGRRVALSFDDGYRDNVALALPRLQRYGARATFFLTAGLIEQRLPPWWDRLAHRIEHAAVPAIEWTIEGDTARLPLGAFAERRAALARLLPVMRVAPELQERRLQELGDRLRVTGEPGCELATWDELGALAAAGMEVGAHSLTHPFLSRLSPERQDAEIGGAVEVIERRMGIRPEGMAYPGGDYDAATLAACARLDLRYAVTTRRADARPGDAPFEVPRRGLSEGACLGPFGRFSSRMATAELAGAFDGWRPNAVAAS